MNKNKPLRYIDLFAGAGGLSEGFIRSGYTPIAHIEIDAAACNTLKTRAAYHWLKRNHKINKYYDYLYGKISRDTLYNLIPSRLNDSVINAEIGENNLKNIFDKIDCLLQGKKPDLIIGGPPCQAYSLVGRSRDKNRMNGDNRNYLYIYYAKFLKRYKPKYFIFENVTGLLSAKSRDGILYFDSMRKLFRESGYATEFQVLSADDYGVLQKRKRIFVVWPHSQPNMF